MATLATIGRQRTALPRLLLLLATAAASSLPARADWVVQSPIPTALEIRGVAAPALGKLFLATEDNSFDEGGALFESTDGGATWVHRDVPESLGSAFHGVQFLDADHGWAWGNENYRTIDGGATWEPLPFLGSTYVMQFFSTTFGSAGGNFGTSVSRDGGLTWEESPEGITTFSFQGSIGLGVAQTGLFRSTDGGGTFVSVTTGTAAAAELLSPAAGVAIVDDSFQRSTDGGATWQPAGAASGKSKLFRVNATTALAYGRTGTWPDLEETIFRTTDGGATWTDLGELFGIHPFPSQLVFGTNGAGVVLAADGAGNLHRSTDSGATWAPVFSTPGPWPGFLATTVPIFAEPSLAYYGFGPGFLIRSTDGGATWTQRSSGTGEALQDVARFPNGDLVAVGANGTVVTSVGGEMPWSLRSSLGQEPLVAVQALGAGIAVAVGESGLVHRTTDGGVTWSAAAPVPTSLETYDLHFQSDVAGYVLGAAFGDDSLLRTTDGGATWAPAGGFSGTWVALDFAGGRGWALAYDGAIRRSLDNGATWEVAPDLPNPPVFLYDLEFWDADVGYAVGSGGYAVRTTDGGATWTTLPTPDPGETFTDIDLLGPGELWLAGKEGKAHYSSSAGQFWSVADAGANGFAGYWAIAGAAGNAWLVGGDGAIRRFDGPPPPPLNQPPHAAFTYVATGLSVAFTDASTDSDGEIVSREWDFGDETTSTESNPTHLFAAAGTYVVSLTVTDDDGATDTTGAIVVVQPLPGGTFGEFTEVTPLDPLFLTPPDEDFWMASAAPADLEGDGDLDLAVLGFYVVYNESVEHRLVLLINQGVAIENRWQFTYVDVPIGEMTTGASDLSWGDVDGDGDPDLLVASEGLSVLYRNNGGSLVATTTVLPPYWEENFQADFDLRSVTWADYDNDGDLDLLLPSVWDEDNFEYRTALLRNDGPAGGGFLFTEVAAGFAPTAHAQSQWADADGDEDLDLLLVHLSPLFGDGFVRKYRNDGGGVFVGEDILGEVRVEHGEAQWGDYDEDGDLDVLVAGTIREPDDTFDTVLRIYRNDAGTYVPVEVIDCPECEGWFDLNAATWADYDSDGDIDILLAGTWNSGSQIEGRAKIYANVDGVFVAAEDQLPAPRSMGDRGGAFTWLDFDGEGDLDYFIAGAYFVPGGNGLVEAQMHLYRNDASEANQPPSAPSNLSADVGIDGTVQLGWTAATDDSTPAAALTYQLRLKRGALPVVAGQLPEPGSLSAVEDWTLTGLPDGYYTWSLVAVDSAYNGGPAAVGDFIVGDGVPPLFADGFETGAPDRWSDAFPP